MLLRVWNIARLRIRWLALISVLGLLLRRNIRIRLILGVVGSAPVVEPGISYVWVGVDVRIRVATEPPTVSPVAIVAAVRVAVWMSTRVARPVGVSAG